MKSTCKYLEILLSEFYFVFIFDDHEKKLLQGLFDLQLKHLIARRRILRNKLKKDFEAEEKAFFSSEGRIDYPSTDIRFGKKER